MKNTAIGDEELRTVSDPVWRILTGAAAFGAGVFVCGSVGSYVPSDPSWNAATGADVQNLFGSAGAVFADIARQILGWSGWIAGLALMIGGAMRAVLVGKPRIRRWVYGLVGVPLSAAAFAAWPVPETWPLSAGLGGMFGDGVFNLAVLPFRALMLPAPESWAGFLLGACALWAGLSALGFQRRDAVLLQETAARSGKHAAVGAAGVGGFLIRIGHQLSAQRPVRMEEGAVPSGDRTLVIKHDDDYVPSSRYLPQDDEDEDDSRYGASAWDDDDEAGEDDDTPATVPAPGLRFAVPRHQPKTTASPKVSKPERRRTSTRLPSLNLLQVPPERRETFDEDALLAKAARLSEVLKEFGIQGRIKEVRPGPVITLFEMEPAPGVKSSRVITLADDIARSMSAVSARVAVVPGKNAIGIELPNDERETVYLRSILQSEAYVNSRATLPVAVGEDIGGMPTVLDLARMPHLLVAGTTGSGKSVGVNAMILSMLYKAEPENVRLIMVDPKMLELSIYEGIPHLLAPVVTDMKQAANALHWCVTEMEKRYKLMSAMGVRNIGGLNHKIKEAEKHGQHIPNPLTLTPEAPEPLNTMPYIVVIIDELADLMMVVGKKVEEQIARLAQKARASGIHLVLATQRPSVDVITGLIKANIPTRLSFQVSSKIDSRTILDQMGAEALLGQGDMLYLAPGTGYPTRVHGAFVSDDEVHRVVEHLKATGAPEYVDDILNGAAGDDDEGGEGGGGDGGDAESDPLYDQAVEIVLKNRRASISLVQRHLRIGYNRSARLIEAMEKAGLVSTMDARGGREVLARRDAE